MQFIYFFTQLMVMAKSWHFGNILCFDDLFL